MTSRATGLSIMTVSRALSDGGFVSARSRKVILVGAKNLDCRINMIARQFMSNRASLQGVQQAVSGPGHHTVLFDGQSEDVNCA